MNKLKQTLEKTLKLEPLFLDSESGELNYIKVKDSLVEGGVADKSYVIKSNSINNPDFYDSILRTEKLFFVVLIPYQQN